MTMPGPVEILDTFRFVSPGWDASHQGLALWATDAPG